MGNFDVVLRYRTRRIIPVQDTRTPTEHGPFWTLESVCQESHNYLANLRKKNIIFTIVNNCIIISKYSPYAQLLNPQLLTHAQLLTVFEQSIFGNSYASNAKAYFQLLTHSKLLTLF